MNFNLLYHNGVVNKTVWLTNGEKRLLIFMIPLAKM